ncbi:MAG: hypothetical protein KJ818_00785, partial [Candidatus Omnitrophica bacterium]|nr:hypothetical protein [Candidatus Omnitrophota bacterium]
LFPTKPYGSTSLSLSELNWLTSIFDKKVPNVIFEEAGLKGIIDEEKIKEQQAKFSLPHQSIIRSEFAKLNYQPPENLKVNRHLDLTPEQSFALNLRRMRHQLTSSFRVPLAGKAAKEGNPFALGEYIDAEGKSLRMSGDFQITGNNGAQDALLDMGMKAGRGIYENGVFGRMLGGGGGGNVLFYLRKGDSNNAEDIKEYERWRLSVEVMYKAWVEELKNPLRGQKVAVTFIGPVPSEGAHLVSLF